MSAETKPVDVLAWLDRVLPALSDLFEITVRRKVTPLSDATEALEAAKRCRTAVAELIETDREYDAAMTALQEVNRKIAEHGWLEVEFDALRAAGTRFVDAGIRRRAALARIGGAA